MSSDLATLDQQLAEVAAGVARALVARRETIAVVESSAGGLISSVLLSQAGASAYFLGGAVVYTAASREALLGITLDDMQGMRSASEPYAQLLARTARARIGASWCLAETGAAGPSGNRYGDAAGHACLAIEGPAAAVVRTLETGSANRTANMRVFAITALAMLAKAL